MRLASPVAAAAALLFAPGARADDSPMFWRPALLVGAQADPLPIPMSAALLTLEGAPVRWASFEIGGGVRGSSPAALGMVHLRVPLRRFAPGVEAGVLAAPLTWDRQASTDGFGVLSTDVYYSDPATQHIGTAVFGRLGGTLALRVMTSGALQLRLHGGATHLLNRAACHWEAPPGQVSGVSGRPCTMGGIPAALPYLGFSIAYAFEP